MLQQIIDFIAAQPQWMKWALFLIIVAGFAWFIIAVSYYQESKRPSVSGPLPASSEVSSPNEPTSESAASKEHANGGSPDKPASTALPEPQANTSTTPIAGRSLEIKKGDLLVLKGAHGIAVVELMYLNGDRAAYRWRHVEKPRGHETTGSGELFEQYGRNTQTSKLVTDLGGERFIKAGPYKIEWSYGSTTTGYVYPTLPEIQAYSVSGTPFAEFRL